MMKFPSTKPPTIITAKRSHTIDCGHRVVGHLTKCKHLHGHGYMFIFYLQAKAQQLTNLGMVVDFGIIKTVLCQWLEDNWDHKTLIWSEDPWLNQLQAITPDSIVEVPFNPTAENLAMYFLEEIAPKLLAEVPLVDGVDLQLSKLEIYETRKCSVIAEVS